MIGPDTYYCSMRCMEIRVIDKTKHEEAALGAAAAMAGEFIDGYAGDGGSTDFANWPEEVYDSFIETIVDAYCDKMRDAAASADPPF